MMIDTLVSPQIATFQVKNEPPPILAKIGKPVSQRATKTNPKAAPREAKMPYPLPELCPLDWEWGYKFVENEQTGQVEQAPLTLLDILYPTGEEFYMAEGGTHHWLAGLLELMIRLHLAKRGWTVFGNIFIHWGRPGMPPLAPDVTAIPQGRYPGNGQSYHVGQDGVTPAFVLEITSKRYRDLDFVKKRWDYAAVRVPEYLIVDLWPKPKKNRPKLLGYRLGNGPFYQQLEADAEGGLTFETIGLRVVLVSEWQVELYDIQTGERLIPPDDWVKLVEQLSQVRAEAEARANQEQARADQAEARIAQEKARAEQEKIRADQAEAELARLRSQLNK